MAFFDAEVRQGRALPALSASPADCVSARHAGGTLPPFRAPMGTWFDPALDFRDPEGDQLTGNVLQLIASVEERMKKRRPDDAANHYTLVRKVLANGFRCHFHRRPALVAYLRKAAGYGDGPEWLSGKGIARTVDLLVRAGLLESILGEWGVAASTYHIKPRLFGVAQAWGISESSLTMRLPPERLVRLREGNFDTPLIAFDLSDETRRWTALLDAYNAFLSQQDIALAVTAEEEATWVEHWNANSGGKGPTLYRPELFKTDLYRQFNNGSFGEGGRLYGGWWINTPKVLREKITINDRPTVELDFSGCAIRMLYHERGNDYRDDPYRLDPISAYEEDKALEPGHFREGIKAMTQAAINDTSGGMWERIPLPSGLSFWPDFKRAEIRRMIEEKHAPIADAFGTGAGLRLQRLDSELALSIISELMQQGIVALPVHDSFVTTQDKKGNLLASMKNEYRKIFGFESIIK